MASAAEVIEKLAREAERLVVLKQVLAMAKDSKDLEELIVKLEAFDSAGE